MKKTVTRPAMAMLVMMVFAADAMAGGTGGAFIQPLLNFITEALKGYVGTAIGVAGLLYALVAGIARGDISGIGKGVGLAVGAYYGPDVITTLSSATITVI